MRIVGSAVLFLAILALTSCHKELVEIEPDGIFTDPRDSIEYPYVTIGTQTWMARNLAFKTAAGSYAYNNDEKFVSDYGRLYTFDEAVRACPDGWQLPSDKDWKDLEKHLGMDPVSADSLGLRQSGDVALALKNRAGWYSGGNGSNTSRFSALPGGFRLPAGQYSSFGDVANYWTSNYDSESHAWGRALIYYETGVYRWKYDKLEGFSVRCLKK